MYSAVEKEIKKLVKQTGISEDFLYDAADEYEINSDGRKSTAGYIINALRNETENYLESEKENEIREHVDTLSELFNCGMIKYILDDMGKYLRNNEMMLDEYRNELIHDWRKLKKELEVIEIINKIT